MSLKNDSNMLELGPESTINVFREEYIHPDIFQHLSKLISNGNSSCQGSLCSMWQAYNDIMKLRKHLATGKIIFESYIIQLHFKSCCDNLLYYLEMFHYRCSQNPLHF